MKQSKKAYLNSARFAQGRRPFSAHDAAEVIKAADAAKAAFIEAILKVDKPILRVKLRCRSMLIGGVSLAAALSLLMYLIRAG